MRHIYRTFETVHANLIFPTVSISEMHVEVQCPAYLYHFQKEKRWPVHSHWGLSQPLYRSALVM